MVLLRVGKRFPDSRFHARGWLYQDPCRDYSHDVEAMIYSGLPFGPNRLGIRSIVLLEISYCITHFKSLESKVIIRKKEIRQNDANFTGALSSC